MKPEEIKAYRKSLNLTQAQLAKKLGKTPNTIARWERGELAVGSPKILRLAFKGLETQVSNPKIRESIKQMKREMYHEIKEIDKNLGLPERDVEFLLK
jgi:transcriptional regulator with XRE-family HTH domain